MTSRPALRLSAPKTTAERHRTRQRGRCHKHRAGGGRPRNRADKWQHQSRLPERSRWRPALAPGQTLRYAWANLATPDALEHFEPLRVVVRLLAGDGSLIAQDAAAAVGAGRLQVFDFSRGAMGGTGDAATPRLQLTVETTVVGRGNYNDIVLKPGIADLDDGVEIIDEATGATVVAIGRGYNELSMDDTAKMSEIECFRSSTLSGVVSANSWSSAATIVASMRLLLLCANSTCCWVGGASARTVATDHATVTQYPRTTATNARVADRLMMMLPAFDLGERLGGKRSLLQSR